MPENQPATGTPTAVTYSDVQGGWLGAGNINTDPMFVSGHSAYTLPSWSPCKYMGNNSYLPRDSADLNWDGNQLKLSPIDLAGNQRKINATVDMGAYEAPGIDQ